MLHLILSSQWSLHCLILTYSLLPVVETTYIPALRAARHVQLRQSGNETVAPSPPWVEASTLQDPPPCVANNIPCKFTTTRIDDCSAIKCITTFDGVCMERAKRVDLSCLCRTLSSQNCAACSTPIERAGYHHWLNLTCGELPNWQGLPKDWPSGFLSLDMMEIGSSGELRGCTTANATGFRIGLDMPACVKTACPMYEKGWRNSMQNGKDTAWANFTISNPAAAISDTDCGLFLSRNHVCGALQQSAEEECPQTMCSTRLEQTTYLLWLNKTCSSARSFKKGMPSNWEADINAGVSSPEYAHPSSDLNFPDCANRGSCADSLADRKKTSSDDFCLFDPASQSCPGNETRVSYKQFCSATSYPLTGPCSPYCTRSYDRRAILQFTNDTCSSVPQWSGLPPNWVDLLEVQVSDVKPWPEVAAYHPSDQATAICPSAEANIAVFAAANLAMLVFTPIFGRRKIVEKLTFGFLGEPQSRGWLYMGPAMALLQLLANTANALIIKAVPGYEHVDTTTLVMLWTTRPRMAWLAVLLVPYQAEDVMYFSCAATSLVVELILQFISSYTFGTVANHARWEGLYNTDSASRLGRVPGFGRAVQMMYGGALLWLLVLVLCLVTLGNSVLAVDKIMDALVGFSSLNVRREKRRLGKARAVCDAVAKAYPEKSEGAKKAADGVKESVTGFTVPTLASAAEVQAILPPLNCSCNQQYAQTAWGQQPNYPQQSTYRYQLQRATCQYHAWHRTEEECLKASSSALLLSQQEMVQWVRGRTDRRPSWWTNIANSMNGVASLKDSNSSNDLSSPAQDRVEEPEMVTVYRNMKQAQTELNMARERLQRSFYDKERWAYKYNNAKKFRKGIIKAESNFRDWMKERFTLAGRRNRRWRNDSKLKIWHELERRWAVALVGWQKNDRRFDVSLAAHEAGNHAKQLRRVIILVFLGMLGCWIAQWVFWIGFLKLYSDQGYCIPRLGTLAGNWIVFSVVGVFMGSSV